MSETTEEVQKVNGTWKGTPLSIKKVWSTHEFTADEIAKLFNDETIEFETLSKTTGKMYTARGKLEEVEFTTDSGETRTYIGFQLEKRKPDDRERFTGTWKGKQVNILRTWSTHRFTDEEIVKLLNGETIEFETLSNKSGKMYKAKGCIDYITMNDNTFIGYKAIFDNK